MAQLSLTGPLKLEQIVEILDRYMQKRSDKDPDVIPQLRRVYSLGGQRGALFIYHLRVENYPLTNVSRGLRRKRRWREATFPNRVARTGSLTISVVEQERYTAVDIIQPYLEDYAQVPCEFYAQALIYRLRTLGFTEAPSNMEPITFMHPYNFDEEPWRLPDGPEWQPGQQEYKQALEEFL